MTLDDQADATGNPGPDEPAVAPARPAADDEAPAPWRNAVEWVVVLVGALAIALVIRTFLFQTFWIPSASMHPTLYEGDRVVVNKLSYHLHPIHPGDVVVFKRPSQIQDPIKDLIKRVIATPGQTVDLRGGRVYIDGKLLEEPYLQPGSTTEPLSGADCVGLTYPLKVPAHQILVMGDNRLNSKDGRCFGTIDENLVVGRAFVRFWPLSDFGWL